ncbi:5440_t:CDS:2 [Cetraspora pellucida]|uniref:5440_t:CDS:1 n=1 Tax=Cetraspora pellucida TaxID=1433469 RepID=A0ACA9LIW8_9GLOM|nr:5440_t:CDS:2 [Cetraspora pellucida]
MTESYAQKLADAKVENKKLLIDMVNKKVIEGEENIAQYEAQIQEEKINSLESVIRNLTDYLNSMKKQSEKIVRDYGQLHCEKESIRKLIKELVKLIKINFKLTEAEIKRLPSNDLHNQFYEVRQAIEAKLGGELMEEVQFILTDCKQLINSKLELEEKFGGQLTIDFTNQTANIDVNGTNLLNKVGNIELVKDYFYALDFLNNAKKEANLPSVISFAEEKLKEVKLILMEKLGREEITRMEQLRKEIVQVTLKEPVQNWLIDQSQPTLEHLPTGRGGYGEVYRDIMNEINILHNLRNRHIIQYYGFYSDNQAFFIIMDYAENGLVYIHQEGIIHRDLKSSNVLLVRGNQVKISDFGLSKTKNVSSSSHYPRAIVAKCTVPFKSTDDSLTYLRIRNNEKEEIPNDTLENIRAIIEQYHKNLPQSQSGKEINNQSYSSDNSLVILRTNDFVGNYKEEVEQQAQIQIPPK